MGTTSLWHAISTRKDASRYGALGEDIEADVVVIGAGITGLTTAHFLVNAGKKVAVLEAYQVGSGTTGDSTGNLYVATQPYYQDIVKKFNLEIAKTIADSRKSAIDSIENIVRENNIDCHFARRPWYIFTDTHSEIACLDKEVETFLKMGFDIDYTTDLPLSFAFKKAAVLFDQARFNPLMYVEGLARELHKNGCLIYEDTKVTDMQEDERLCHVTTTNGRVKAKNIVLATHTPKGVNPIQMFTAPYRSYVVAVSLPTEVYPEGHFWGMDQYISSTHAVDSKNPSLLLVAGSHHKTGQGDDASHHFQKIQGYIKKYFPNHKIEYQWSAQHYQAADDVPYIGLAHKSAKHTYMATGFFADGLTYGTIAGKVMSDLILNKNNALANIYNPHRSSYLASAGPFIKENVNVFVQYLKDLPFVARKNYNYLKPGEGKVVEIHGEKCAVSKSLNNELHVVSAVCPHMKCIVNWNDAEKTWDCPCHGSRFAQDGRVLEGPAISDLEKKST